MAKKLIFLLLLVLFLPLVIAVPPFVQTSEQTVGLIIQYPPIDSIVVDQDYKFYFHIFNASNGIPVNNDSISCNFHLYNSNGSHIITASIPHEDQDVVNEWEMKVLGGNFTTGHYDFIVQCNSSTLGGYDVVPFTVSRTGEMLTTQASILYIGLFAILLLFFVLIIYFIGSLPDDNKQDEEGQLISIGWMKYLRSTLMFFEWMLLIAIFYLTSNLAFAYLQEELFANILFVIFKISLGITPLIVIVWFFWIFISIMKDKKLKKLMESGLYSGGGKW